MDGLKQLEEKFEVSGHVPSHHFIISPRGEKAMALG